MPKVRNVRITQSKGWIICANRTGGASAKGKADRQPQNQSIPVLIADFLQPILHPPA
jgi:hypothetical protein